MSEGTRELIADLFISLDGFARGADSPAYFGYFGPELEQAIHQELETPQLSLMGRVTYEALAKVASVAHDKVNDTMSRLPKAVVSNTLREPLSWSPSNTRLISGDGIQAIGRLKQEPGDPVRTIGSISLVRDLMQHGLVDRLRLTVFPIILGPRGREPLYEGFAHRELALVESRVLDSRLLRLEYRPVAGG
jgi:dihydrofolate reductase